MTQPRETPDSAIEILIEKVSGDARAMVMLARTLLIPSGRTKLAEKLCRQALDLAPHDAEVRAMAHAVRSRCVAGWYFTMVRDEQRHALYAEALGKILISGCTVLDIGAGTGLFAMLAARQGAGMVIACEKNAVVAGAAAETVEKNGYSDCIQVITKDSRHVEVGAELDSPADILLWDNLANDLFGAGALETIEDARRRLLKPGAPILPARCEVRLALVQSGPTCGAWMNSVAGFDMTTFNRFRPTQVTFDPSDFEWRSDSATIFDLVFAEDETLKPRTSRAEVKASGGRVDGVIQWLRFHIAESVIYDTGERGPVSAFGMQYHAVEPFETAPGQQVAIAGAHDRQRSWFWVERSR